MARARRATGLLAAALMLAAASPVLAQTTATDLIDDHVLLSAEQVSHDQELGVVTATGNVELSKGRRVILADTISYNRRADLVTASGNVALLEPTGEVLFADYVELKDDLRSGAIEGIRILLSDESRFAANGGRLTADGRTRLSKAVYSPCEPCAENPDRAPIWQVKAYEVIHDKNLRRIFYSDAFLEVFGIPVAYVPFFSHPDPTVVRKTGFLPPTFGSDSVLGVTYEQPFFFDISPSQDATLAPILTTKEGVVLTGEYRRAVENGNIKVSGSVTRADREPVDTKETERTRGHIFANGDFTLSPAWRWGFDLNRASDATYLGRYRFSRGEQALISDLFAEGARGRDFASIRALSFQSLDPDVDESAVPYVTPIAEYSFRGEPSPLGGYWMFDAGTRVLGRSVGADSRRLTATGAWRLPFTTKLGEVYQVTASVRGDLYHVANVPDPKTASAATLNGVTGRLAPRLDIEWRYPFARTSGNVHQVIEPIAQVAIGPNGGNPDRIPNEDSLEFEFDDINLFSASRFTGLDRIEGGARLNYGLRLATIGAGGGRSEILFGQSYRARDDSTFEVGTGLSDHFSDFVGRLTIAPSANLNLQYRFRLDRDNLAARRGSVSVRAGPPRLHGEASYITLSDIPTTGVPSSVEQLNLVARIGIARRWSFSLVHQRDLTDDGGSLLTGGGLTYEDDCVLLQARLDRNFTQDLDIEPSTTFTIQVRLRNLG